MVVNVPRCECDLASVEFRSLSAAEATNKPEKEFIVEHERLQSAWAAAAVVATDSADF